MATDEDFDELLMVVDELSIPRTCAACFRENKMGIKEVKGLEPDDLIRYGIEAEGDRIRLIHKCREKGNTSGAGLMLDDEEKMRCLEALHCSKAQANNKEIFKTWTSHWVKKNRVSKAAYDLFKVKRWYLDNENLLFDPLNKCATNHAMCIFTPDTTLWRDFKGKAAIQEGMFSVDSILNLHLTSEQRDMLEKLDTVMKPLHEDIDIPNKTAAQFFCIEMMDKLLLLPDWALVVYTDFVRNISECMRLHRIGQRLSELYFEEMFMKMVQCVSACIGGPKTNIRCERNIYGSVLERSVIPVKSKEKAVKLEISSLPDLFVYLGSDVPPSLVLAVAEVKGLVNDEFVHSDDDGEEEGGNRDPTHCYQHQTDESDDGDDAEDSDDEEDNDFQTQRKLIGETPPTWLKPITDLSKEAIKVFLPQLIGEMMCCARSKSFTPIKAEGGLLLGIGVIGFDVYFVSLLDSCRDTPKSVVNNNSACTHVFVTRPFNIRKRDDRRIILKTISATLLISAQPGLI